MYILQTFLHIVRSISSLSVLWYPFFCCCCFAIFAIYICQPFRWNQRQPIIKRTIENEFKHIKSICFSRWIFVRLWFSKLWDFQLFSFHSARLRVNWNLSSNLVVLIHWTMNAQSGISFIIIALFKQFCQTDKNDKLTQILH